MICVQVSITRKLAPHCLKEKLATKLILVADGAKILCNMKSDLTNVPLNRFEKKKKRAWQFWKSYKTHYIARYKVKFHIQPAGIDFALWFDGNEYRDPNLKSFEVEWEAGAQLAAPKDHLDVDRDWNGYR